MDNHDALASKTPTRSTTPSIVTSSAVDRNRPAKSHSTTHLPTVASAAAISSQQPHDRSRSDNLDFNTLSRTPTPLSNASHTPPGGSPHHPDLSSEVASLSTKLINAINHQTNLDDSLQEKNGELEAANLENEILQKKLNDEQQQRLYAEREKRRVENEVEDLTASLFQNANTMVASARQESEAKDQQIEHLRTQLKNAEMLVSSHQDQLRELKDVMQQDRSTNEAAAQASTPGTPVIGVSGKRSFEFNPTNQSAGRFPLQAIQPDHPLSFAHLLSPVLRTDLQGFDDFVSMLKAGVNTVPSSRTNSGNFAGLNVMGIGSLNSFTQSNVTRPAPHSSPSASSLATSSPQPQTAPGAFPTDNGINMTASPTITSTLKDQRFYKRALQEDIEPTLRLDAAPGLSFFAKRNLVGSMVSGNLIVEPFGPSSRYWSSTYSCALCGEARDDEQYMRRHRFYKGDSDDAQRYMVCDYCLGRLRATGDYINFLRMIRSGYWKGESIEDSKVAWEECTKLRERMFWARLGGGVVPAMAPLTDQFNSPRASRNVSTGDQPADENAIRGAAVPIVKPVPSPASAGAQSRPSISTSPERRPGSSGSQRFLAARSRFESSSDSLSNSRCNTPTAVGASERRRSETSERTSSPSKSPKKTSMMPGTLKEK